MNSVAPRPRPRYAASERSGSGGWNGIDRPGLDELHALGIRDVDVDLAGAMRHEREVDARILAEGDVALDGHDDAVAIAHADVLHEMRGNVVARDLVELHARKIRMADQQLR